MIHDLLTRILLERANSNSGESSSEYDEESLKIELLSDSEEEKLMNSVTNLNGNGEGFVYEENIENGENGQKTAEMSPETYKNAFKTAQIPTETYQNAINTEQTLSINPAQISRKTQQNDSKNPEISPEKRENTKSIPQTAAQTQTPLKTPENNNNNIKKPQNPIPNTELQKLNSKAEPISPTPTQNQTINGGILQTPENPQTYQNPKNRSKTANSTVFPQNLQNSANLTQKPENSVPRRNQTNASQNQKIIPNSIEIGKKDPEIVKNGVPNHNEMFEIKLTERMPESKKSVGNNDNRNSPKKMPSAVQTHSKVPIISSFGMDNKNKLNMNMSNLFDSNDGGYSSGGMDDNVFKCSSFLTYLNKFRWVLPTFCLF